MLIPFPHQAGEVTLDKVHVVLSEAVASFPFALGIGHYLETCTATELYGVRDMVYDAVGCVFDSRLATQYAFSLACVQKVSCTQFFVHMHVLSYMAWISVVSLA